MRKKTIVLETLGAKIKQYGFSYSSEQSDNIMWTFVKKIGQIEQRILVQDCRFESGLILRFETSAYGTPMIDACEIIPKNVYGNQLGTWVYMGEPQFRQVLNEFVDIIENYGIVTLNEISIEDEVIPTKEMGEQLLNCHKQLNDKFIEKHEMYVEVKDKEAVLKWFEVIEEIMSQTKEQPYRSVQDELVEIAAFLGEQLKDELGGKWEKFGEYRNVRVASLGCDNFTSYPILARVVASWKYRSIQKLREEYLWMLDAKLPLTEEKMIELQERLTVFSMPF